MKKNTINKKKIGKYKTGGTVSDMDKANAIGQAAQFAGTQLGQMFEGLENGKQASVGSTLAGLGGGAASGAAIGTMLAPGIGTAIGAGAGALLGGIAGGMGSGGSVNELTSEYTMPSGIAGMFGHSKGYIRRKTNTIRTGIQSEVDSNRLAADYYSENGYNMPTMAAKGGIIPNTLAYLDDGELIRTPDGQIGAIPEEGKPEDSNLTNVPVGTQVLSDKLKVPGTNKTFAEMGKKLMNTKMKGSGLYAENSKKLNDRNNQIKYNQLLAQQESLKNGNQNKIGKYANGSLAITEPDKALPLYTGQFGTGLYSEYVNKPTTYTKSELKEMDKNVSNQKLANVLNQVQDFTNLGLALSGPISNLGASKPTANAPYTFTPKFGPTEYNIDPILNEIVASDAIARYNLSNINPNTGANLAFGLQSAANRNRAIANAYSQKVNAENQTAMQNAGIYNQWGQYTAQARHQAAVENAQDMAAYRTAKAKAKSEISTTLQQYNKDKRLSKRDMALLNFMAPYLQYGATNQSVMDLINQYK